MKCQKKLKNTKRKPGRPKKKKNADEVSVFGGHTEETWEYANEFDIKELL